MAQVSRKASGSRRDLSHSEVERGRCCLRTGPCFLCTTHAEQAMFPRCLPEASAEDENVRRLGVSVLLSSCSQSAADKDKSCAAVIHQLPVAWRVHGH